MSEKKGEHASVGDNGKFVVLVQLARETGETGSTIRRIVALDGPERKTLINGLIVRMNGQGEDKDLIEAVKNLFNDEIAAQVRQTVNGKSPQKAL